MAKLRTECDRAFDGEATPRRARRRHRVAFALLLAPAVTAGGEVDVVAAEFKARGEGMWDVSVTLRHGDTGWEHYADAWRVVDAEGTVFGTRELLHPHVTEQPFTRSLGGVRIPPSTTEVLVEGRDKVHGWSRKALAVPLGKATDGRIVVKP